MLTDKDKEAIAHIARVSKHPHAAMIVEWLITECKVEYYNKTEEGWLEVYDSSPRWVKEFNYRLIYPKIKPAYRVYYYPGSKLLLTQQRDENGAKSKMSDESQAVFLSDWVEYAPPPEGFDQDRRIITKE